jgi:hypothetical protein
MRRPTVALIPIVVSLVLAACTGDRDTTAPRLIAPTKTVSATVLPATCSLETAEQIAPTYFPSGDAGIGLVDVMEDGSSDPTTRNKNGFNVLARIAAVRHLPNHGPATAGGQLVLNVVACMSVGVVPDTFDPAASLAGGVFEVRGNTEGTLTNPVPAATAWNLSPGTAATPAVPLWGVEPSGLWARSGAPRYLIYGYPLGADVVASGFQLGSLPANLTSPSFPDPASAFRVGLCIPQALGTTAANRIVHSNSIVTDLTDVTLQGAKFCAPGYILGSLGTSSWLASLVNKATSLFTPRTLSAQDAGLFGIGGLPDGWSPFTPSQLAGSSMVLAYVQQPTNENVNTDIVPTVTVSGRDGAFLLPGLRVTISITGNHGSPDIISGNTATTDKFGVATFPHLQLNKAGGYTLTASGSLSGVVTNTTISKLFNVKNK